MIKKIAILFSLALVALGVNAQLPTGGWAFHPTFNGVSSVTETQGKVYYLSGSSLFSVDKQTGEMRSLNISNDLNGATISNIFTQPDGKYVIVTYIDANMDRLNDDGSVVNISDIHDASVNGSKTIKHVGFGNGKFYVTTDFGLVTFDEKKNEARETMFTPSAPVFAYVLGDKLIISYDKKLMAADATKKIVSLDQFSLIGGNATENNFSSKGFPIGDNRLLLVTAANGLVIAHFEFDNDRLVYFANTGISGVTGIFKMNDGQGIAYNGTTAAVFNSTDYPASPQKLTFPASLKNYKFTAFDGWGSTWAGSTDGIAQYDLSTFSSPVQLCDKFGATDFSAANCNRIFTQDSGDILFWNATRHLGYVMGWSETSNLKLAGYSHGEGFTNLWPSTSEALAEPSYVIQDLHDPDTYYVCAFWKYLYRIKNGKVTFTFKPENSGINWSTFSAIAYMGFDEHENFWVVQENPGKTTNTVHCISYEDLSQETPAKEAWKNYDMPNTFRTTMGAMLKQSHRMVFARGQYTPTMTFFDNKGTKSFDDDTFQVVTTYIDQDNKTIPFSVASLLEDAKGRLWIGTDNGILEITDPSKINSETAVVNHLKVPRNDGTGLADYLLESQIVSGLACDNSNRKWASTTTNGVYLISENGDQILENFTTENSILPSNRVWSVACDPNSSSVFFATDAGVVEYNSTSSPAMKNLNEVYAYPNPVRPDYSGWITITGLMNNTLVKIADAAGNVFFQGRSEGGMITWDGCNAAGERVKTGVYYVFASSGTANDSSYEGCVTKIMVVN